MKLNLKKLRETSSFVVRVDGDVYLTMIQALEEAYDVFKMLDPENHPMKKYLRYEPDSPIGKVLIGFMRTMRRYAL